MTTSTPAAKGDSRLPLALTLFRIAATPLIAGLILFGHAIAFKAGLTAMSLCYLAALILFIAAALSDWADGWLARRTNAVTPLGAALDHAADKVLTTVTLMALIYAILPLSMVVAAMVIVGRDVAIAGLREGLGTTSNLAVSRLGKVKAGATMAAIILVLAQSIAAATPEAFGIVPFLNFAAKAMLYSATFVAVVSAGQYLRNMLQART